MWLNYAVEFHYIASDTILSPQVPSLSLSSSPLSLSYRLTFSPLSLSLSNISLSITYTRFSPKTQSSSSSSSFHGGADAIARKKWDRENPSQALECGLLYDLCCLFV